MFYPLGKVLEEWGILCWLLEFVFYLNKPPTNSLPTPPTRPPQPLLVGRGQLQGVEGAHANDISTLSAQIGITLPSTGSDSPCSSPTNIYPASGTRASVNSNSSSSGNRGSNVVASSSSNNNNSSSSSSSGVGNDGNRRPPLPKGNNMTPHNYPPSSIRGSRNNRFVHYTRTINTHTLFNPCPLCSSILPSLSLHISYKHTPSLHSPFHFYITYPLNPPLNTLSPSSHLPPPPLPVDPACLVFHVLARSQVVFWMTMMT